MHITLYLILPSLVQSTAKILKVCNLSLRNNKVKRYVDYLKLDTFSESWHMVIIA